MWQIAANSGRLQLGHQFWHTDDVDYPPEIVDEHMKAHLGLNIRQSFHDEVRRTHAVLDRGLGVFHDLLSPSHRLRLLFQLGLCRLQYVFLFPALDAPFLAGCAVCFQRAS